MQIPAASEMKSKLDKDLKSMLALRQNFMEAGRALAGLNVDLNRYSVDIDDACASILKHYFENLCRDLTRFHCDGTPAEVSLDSDYYTFDRSYSYRDEDKEDDSQGLSFAFKRTLDDAGELPLEEQFPLMDELLGRIQFDAIEADLKKQVTGLVDQGHSIIAGQLISDLRMNSVHTGPEFKGRHVIFQTHATDYWHNRSTCDEARRINQSLLKVTEFSGVDFGWACNELIRALNGLTYDQQSIPSRTTFEKGSPLEITCYKQYYKFKFTHAAFDALSAFIMLHGTESQQEIIANLTQQLHVKVA